MYIPKPFEERRPEVLHDLIRQHSFGTLVSHGAEGMTATHLPLLLDAGRGPHGTLMGHVARANPQWRSFSESVELLAIFQGPHTYVSPAWYEAPLSVPTWNYAAVHAYGIASLLEGETDLIRLLETMVRTYEAGNPEPWRMKLPDSYLQPLLRAIVGFEIPITRLEGKLKLSQNRSPADQRGVIDALTRQGDLAGGAVAALMQTGGAPATNRPLADD